MTSAARSLRAAWPLALALAAVVASAAAADRLVLRDGTSVETRGAWEVQGKLVVFRLANGSLSSLRLAEVDLEASAAATAAAAAAAAAAVEAQPPAAPPAAPARPGLRLTDADVPRASPAAIAAEEEPPAGLRVVAWSQSRREGVVVTGQVRNDGDEVAEKVRLTVKLYDGTEKLVGAGLATLATRTLEPGQTSSFLASFPNLSGDFAAEFEFEHARREPEPAPASGTADGSFGDRLEVVEWQQIARPEVNGTEITGRLRNPDYRVAGQITLTVEVYDAVGELIDSADAFLDTYSLPGGQETRFRALFSGIRSFGDVRFEASASELMLQEVAPIEGQAPRPPSGGESN